ncbi:hypothetical protein DL98DRAFT_655937 [Cadophora sp. DSE1049]|nr:hypothetical protein DL98DRAFT_655937 [Cadophora sp. DSE1049]
MDNLSASQKAQLQEVADGMLKIYHTLSRMSYLDATHIHPGPHDIRPLLPLYHSLNLSPSIIYLYSILPYIDSDSSGLEEFFQGGRFADFRKEEHVKEGRNPLYDELEEDEGDGEDGRDGIKGGLRSWMTPLSLLGNHGSVIIYDARKHCIGIIDHESCGSADRNIDLGYIQLARSDGNDSDDEGEGKEKRKSGRGDEDQDDGEIGDEEGENDDWEDVDEDDDDEESEGESQEGIYDSMPSRHAPDVLRDIVRWFEDLSEIPERAGVNADVNKEIYQNNKWPTADFDTDGLLVDQARAEAAASARYESEEPIREVWKYQGWIKDEDGPVMRSLRAGVEDAKGENELWLARWELWKAEEGNRRMGEKLRDAERKRDVEFPGGKYRKEKELIFGEISGLYEGMWARRRDVADVQAEIKETEDDGKDVPSALKSKLLHAEKILKVYEKAYEAARADMESSFPGRSIAFGRGIQTLGLDLDARIASLTPNIEDAQQQLQEIRAWMSQLPDAAVQAKQAAEDEILGLESRFEAYMGQIRGCTEALEELDRKAG